MKTLFAFLALTILTGFAHTAHAAITQQEVIQLLQLRTPEQEIIDKIKAGGTTFTLGAEDIARLQRAGATPAIIAAMQGGGAGGVDPTIAEITDLCLVVDYSGSMSAATTDGSTKIAVAKKAVAQLIDTLPADLNVAVVVYGVRKDRGCEDIDLIQPLGRIDKAALKQQLVGLSNTGMTPIAGSLEIAGLALKNAKGGRAIVLVTDGVESCKGDPAAVASKLAAEFGVKFGLHVVGFDIKPEERAALESISRNGHGKYFNASNAAELVQAMQKVTESVAVAPKQRDTRKYEASGEAKKGGLWFHEAPIVQPGEYSGTLVFREARYYAVPVRKGQEVRAIATIKKGTLPSKATIEPPVHQDFAVAIYSPTLAVAAREEIKTKENVTTPLTARATWTSDVDGLAYVCIGATTNYDRWNRDEGKLDNAPEPSSYSLRIRAEGEPFAATAPKIIELKAGNNAASAAQIQEAGLIVSDIKFGENAFYSIPVNKGEVLQVGLAAQKPYQKRSSMAGGPAIDAEYQVIIYDDDQVEVAKQQIKLKQNPPDAGGATVNWPVTLSGKATILIALAEADAKDIPAGPAHIALLVKKSGP